MTGVTPKFALRWAICLLILAAGALAAGYRCRLSWDDARKYSGADLFNRVGAARTLDEGIDPYTYRKVDGALVRRWNEHPYSPALIWAYVPLSRQPYSTIRDVDFWAEWAALASAALAAALAFRGAERAAWAGGLLALVSSQFSWRLHVERGQAYVFLAALLGAGFGLLSCGAPHGRRRGPRPAAPSRPTAGAVAATLFGGVAIGVAAVVRPSLAVAVLLLPLCGRWRAAGVAALAAAIVFALTLLPGDRGYWPGYVRVVERLEQEYLFPGTINPADDGADLPDPTLADDVYTRPDVWRRLRSRSGNLVADVWLWPDVERRYGWPGKAQYPVASRCAAAATLAVAAALIGLLVLRGAPRIDRLAVAAAATVGVDFFVPVRYEYADVLYLVPLAIAVAAVRRRSLAVAVLLALGTLWGWEDPATMGLKDSAAASWRALTMLGLPAATAWTLGMIFGPHRADRREPAATSAGPAA